MGTDYHAWTSLPRMFFEQAARHGDKPFLWAKQNRRYAPLSWTEVAERVNAFANGLIALGARPGERVMLVSENRPEWLIADLGIMAAGCVTVPAYVTNTVSDHLHVMNDSGSSFVVASTAKLSFAVLKAIDQSNAMPRLIAIEQPEISQTSGEPPVSWQEVEALGRGAPLPLAVKNAKRDDLACLIYTSGTGGAPKGVMLTHGNILHNCLGAEKLLETVGLDNEVFLSFLPLSHAYEHTAGQFFPITIGAQIYYGEGLDKLSTNLVEAHPTIMTAVPRLYELLRDRILQAMERETGLKAHFFRQAVALGIKAYQEPGSLSLAERAYNRLLDAVVRRKMADRFGGRLKAMVSGGGPLNLDVGLFFHALGVPILQGYGQTEAAPVVSCNPPRKVKMHTVGLALEGVEVMIALDGEILVRGPLVMSGYWNNPKATRETIDRDGWLHTGDIGVIDHDGYIQITDRKKDIIVNSGGDNIAPQRVEGFLTLEPEIAQAMAYGDKRPHLVAVVVPDAEYAMDWAEANGKPKNFAKLLADPHFEDMIRAAVNRVNAKLSNIEKVRRFLIADAPFTVDNGLMTPTLKVKRHKIIDIYGERLEGLY